VGKTGASRETRRPALLTAVDTSWAEPDSLEGEIVKALSVKEEHTPPQSANPAAPLSAAAKTGEAKIGASPATTLGDLAERLEEALAREVKAANQNRSRVTPDLDAFGFQTDAPSRAAEIQQSAPAPVGPAPQQHAPQQLAPEQQKPSEMEKPAPPKVVAPAPEPERREARAQAERQDEAPVISLNARRREAADPLEDEMARLLGELTGDTTRR